MGEFGNYHLARMIADSAQRFAERPATRIEGPDGQWQVLTYREFHEAIVRAAQMATLSTAGSGVEIEASGAAKLLLLAGEPLREVARACGFAELSPFYRAFRRWYGQTPEQYRQQHLAADLEAGTETGEVLGQ